MADLNDIAKNVELSLPKQMRSEYSALITKRVAATVRSISAERYWSWRLQYKTFTSADSDGGIYEWPADCAMIAEEGTCLVDSNGLPLDRPVIYISEQEFNERYVDLDTMTGNPLYLIPIQMSDKTNIQSRIFPDLESGDSLKGWYARTVSSNDLRFMRELTVIYMTLAGLPIEAFGVGSFSQKNYEAMAYNELKKDIIADKRIVQDKLEFRQSADHRAHYSYIRRLQS